MSASPQIMEHDWFPRPLPGNFSLGHGSWCYSSFSCIHNQSRHPKGVSIGHDSGIYHGTFFDLGPNAEVVIGNFCTLVGAIIATNRRILIGNYTFIAHEVVLADSSAPIPFNPHSPVPPPQSPDPNTQSPAIEIAENCWIGARSILLAGARVGEGSIVGAGAVIDFEIPPFHIAAGNPGRVVGKLKTNHQNADKPQQAL